MSIEGRIAVDVSFADSATSSGVQSLKKISLTDTTSYTSGKVAIVTGTCGTAAVTVNSNPTTYRDAAGNLVSFSAVQRVAALGSKTIFVSQPGSELTVAASENGLAVSDATGGEEFAVQTTAGTASYTLVLYGT